MYHHILPFIEYIVIHVYRYPVKGYLPLQDPPHLVLQQSAFLVQCMDRLVFYNPPDKIKVDLIYHLKHACYTVYVLQNDQAKILSTDTIKLIVIYHILEQLAPLLVCYYGDG